MSAAKIKKGDTVIVLSGKDKGKEGTVTKNLPRDGKVVVSGLSNSESLQTDQAVAIKCLVSVAGQEGVQVAFKSRLGEAVLNGIQLRKLR